MNDCEILFRRIKNVALRKPYRSRRFREFVLSRLPGKTFHHVFGSVHGLKSTDLLGTAEKGTEHLEGQRDRDWLIDKIPEAVGNLLRYVEFLESKEG